MKSLHIPMGVRRVLFRTLNTDRRLMWKKEFDTRYVGFTKDGAQWLVENTDIKLVVAFKLSKRKPDDNLQMLHTILFGKKTKAHSLKRNIGQFSGYVWVENEEKQRARVKEKIDKYVKEKLLDFCDVLNIPINRGNVKKEELSTKLLEFLESPHPTTDTLLADKEQKGKKRKGKTTTSRIASSGEASEEASVKSLGVEAYTSRQGLNLKLCYNKARRRRVQVISVPLQLFYTA